MKAQWRFPQSCDDLLTRHFRLDGQQILIGRRFLTLTSDVATSLPVAGGKYRMGCEEKNGQQREDVNPQTAARKQRLLHFQADDIVDLGPPELGHRTTSSLPIRYS